MAAIARPAYCTLYLYQTNETRCTSIPIIAMAARVSLMFRSKKLNPGSDIKIARNQVQINMTKNPLLLDLLAAILILSS